MKSSKIGRNDPCPCGSGKKYKHCCLALEGIVSPVESPFERYNRLVTTLKMKIEQNYAGQIRKVRRSARENFLRLCTSPSLNQDQEPLFSDWLWFDMPDTQGLTMGREYLQENGSSLEPSLRECLEALNSSHLSLYETHGMESGCLKVVDYLSGQEELVLLKESLDIEIGDKLPLLLGRLLTLPLGRIFSGSVLMLGNDAGQGEFIRMHMDYWRRISGWKDLKTGLKKGEVLFGLFDRALHKTELALNDIRGVRDPQQLAQIREQLKVSTTWLPSHVTQGVSWYDLSAKKGQARLGVGSDFAAVYADRLEDILLTEELWSDIVPRDSWEIVNSQLLFQAPQPELEYIWYTVIKERETERWLHTKHRELSERTPAGILGEANGQEQLLAMLDEFAAQAALNASSLDLVDYMRARISQGQEN
ncbi:MAG: SEC-C metal-binding domain-containing protein [Syntrophomonadaceae bacterium]